MAAETLQEAGWRVLKAPDGRAALSLLECRGGSERIDLLFSDVVMPGGLSGVALAHAARRLRPEIAVLLASGYAGEALAAEGAGGAADFPLLGKPYDRATLLAAIAALTAPSSAAARPEMAVG
jgi:CheY-like chemotaxis protein